MKEFWVVTSGVNESSAALISRCRELAEERELKTKVIIIEENSPVWVEPAVDTLRRLYLERQPEAIIFECDRFFGDVAPSFACSVGKGITADCTSLEWDGRYGLLQIRPTYGGRKIAVNRSIEKPYIATVRVGCFGKCPPETVSDVDTERPDIGESASPIELIRRLTCIEQKKPLEASEIILSGGLGIGSREGFEKLRALAELMGAGVGASRAAVAAGYADYSAQVGQTGVSVHPKLYVAFGISGAVQHLSGILGAEKIVAVNTDPKAPIHDYSNYSVIADCGEVIDALTRHFQSGEM